MTKAEIKKAIDSEIIVEYVSTYACFTLNYNLGGGIKAYSKHLEDLETEMIKRGILSEEQVRRLNA